MGLFSMDATFLEGSKGHTRKEDKEKHPENTLLSTTCNWPGHPLSEHSAMRMGQVSPSSLGLPKVVKGEYATNCPQDTLLVLFQVRVLLWHVDVETQHIHKDPGKHLDKTDPPNG